jgi:hypothetical protein
MRMYLDIGEQYKVVNLIKKHKVNKDYFLTAESQTKIK